MGSSGATAPVSAESGLMRGQSKEALSRRPAGFRGLLPLGPSHDADGHPSSTYLPSGGREYCPARHLSDRGWGRQERFPSWVPIVMEKL